MPDFWDVFKLPPPQKLPSAGPGAGPAQADSTHLPWQNRTLGPPGSGKPGSPIEPRTEDVNDTGYGGGADSVQIVAPTEQRPVRGVREWLRQVPPGPAVPRYNIFYDTLRTRDSWRYLADGIATGTITPAATTVQVAVTLTETVVGGIIARMSQYPGGIQMHLCIHTFSAAPQATTQTGNVTFFVQDAVGSPAIPLGVGMGSGAVFGQNLPKVFRNPFTDAGLNGGTIAQLFVTTGGGGTFGAWNWQIGVSFGYILPDPAFSGYSALLPIADQALGQEIQQSIRRG